MKRNKHPLSALMPVFCALLISCTPQTSRPSDSIRTQNGPKAFIVNTRVFTFDSSKLEPWLDEITHLSAFGVDFKKGKIAGEYQRPFKARMDDFISFCQKKNIKVVWTLNMQSDTLQDELQYVTSLIQKGLPISAFKYGGEFYLGKYYYGDLSKKGVVEKVNIDIYLKWLKEWIPAFTKKFPFDQYDHILVGASYGVENNKSNRYRRQWNQKLIKMLDNNPKYAQKLAVDFHHYAGENDIIEPQGEETVRRVVDFTFLRDFPDEMPIYITESGFRITDYSKDSLDKTEKYWSTFYEQLGPDDLYGVHLLYHEGMKNPHAIYLEDGSISPVGKRLQTWLKRYYP